MARARVTDWVRAMVEELAMEEARAMVEELAAGEAKAMVEAWEEVEVWEEFPISLTCLTICKKPSLI